MQPTKRADKALLAAAATALFLAGSTPSSARAEAALTHEQINRGSLIASYYAPADAKRHPAVIVLGGSEGGLHDANARLLAEHGFAALALAYFGVDPLPKQLRLVRVETVSVALDWLAARPEVDANRIGIEGGSKGAELALLAATREPRIRAAALISPTDTVWFGLAFGSGPETSSWSEKGLPVPYVPSDPIADAAVGQAYASGGTVSFRDTFDASWNAASPEVRSRALIPVERFAGPILCVAGADDREWNSAAACTAIAARRARATGRSGDESAIEPDAGHLLPFSGTPVSGTMTQGPLTMLFGGTPAGNGKGGADAFTRMVAFFGRTLSM